MSKYVYLENDLPRLVNFANEIILAPGTNRVEKELLESVRGSRAVESYFEEGHVFEVDEPSKQPKKEVMEPKKEVEEEEVIEESDEDTSEE